MHASIKAIEYYLPAGVLTNEQFIQEYPEWTVDKIKEKIGIEVRHIASKEECASDLAVEAAKKIFACGVCSSQEIDYLLFCTQSPDYYLPTTACLIQDRLGIPRASGAVDINLGCSGYIYGLGLAKGLIETRQASSVLLITAETYSKHIHPGDKSVRTLFGDAAAATLIQGISEDDSIGPFVYGTDGRGGANLIVPTGGFRCERNEETAKVTMDENGNLRSLDNLFMNGSEIFAFTLNAVPKNVKEILEKAGKKAEDIDLYIFHQANKFILEHLRKKINIPNEKFYLSFAQYGNTVSSTIPIAIKDALTEGKIRTGSLVMLVGFGVGYSWGATLIRWR